MENNSNVKLFDFEKLELKQGSVIHLIANYQYFLEEYKKSCSYLVVIQNNSLNKKNSKKIANNFYFAKMLLLEECNTEEQKIFDELKELQNKIITKKIKIMFLLKIKIELLVYYIFQKIVFLKKICSF